ncbi:MAG TPA: anhydro-N-acetylmuramic acid kinase [Alphaproteobacteria bacterium]|nr:anhydro-N-acetylmuramic acid kinase [Alphaproteobacteria bacterium]
MSARLFLAIGLMSGTSIDGIDAALIETDGEGHVRPLGFLTTPYESDLRARLRRAFGNKAGARDPEIAALERELTVLHADIVQKFLRQGGLARPVDLIGFHGQTIWHQPEERATIQIGDGALLAKLTGLPVVNDFRAADMKAGGHGAPLVPLYHRALAAKLPKPVAILNIGGVANVTWIGGGDDDEIVAYDVGPGVAMIDDWILRHAGQAYDEYGVLAASGHPDEAVIERFMGDPFFAGKPPKSLDRNAFKNPLPEDFDPADGAATLTMMTVRAIVDSLRFMPRPPMHLYVTGGGRHNNTLMRWVGELADIPVSPVDALSWSGDGLEAEAFAYLAVRSQRGLPLTVPGTTGVSKPTTGGTLHMPEGEKKKAAG